MIPHRSQMASGSVKEQKPDHDGNPIELWSDNPILNTCLYDIEFPDGEIIPLTANALAQAMYD